MSNELITKELSEEELLFPTQAFFTVKQDNDLSWEGFANSKEEVEARFPGADVSEWEPTEFVGIWML